MFVQRRDDGHEVSDEPARLDLDLMWSVLRRQYWSPNVPRDVVVRAVEHSLPFGLYAPDGRQVGFCRAVTDRAVFAYLGDVFVVEEERGRGLGAWLIEQALRHPDLQGLRRIMLATRDAHGLYERFGFRPFEDPSMLMSIERRARDLYG